MILDCRGQRCPQPVIDLARAVRQATAGTTIVILTDDPAAAIDIPAWSRMRGHQCECTAADGQQREHRVVVS